MIKRILIFTVLLTIIWSVQTAYYVAVQPEIGTELTLRSVNGDNTDSMLVRSNQKFHNTLPLILAGLVLVSFLVCFGAPIKRKIVSLPKENA